MSAQHGGPVVSNEWRQSDLSLEQHHFEDTDQKAEF